MKVRKYSIRIEDDSNLDNLLEYGDQIFTYNESCRIASFLYAKFLEITTQIAITDKDLEYITTHARELKRDE